MIAHILVEFAGEAETRATRREFLGVTMLAPDLAGNLHRMWVDRTDFNWSTKKAAA
jgi:hypothetical protein